MYRFFPLYNSNVNIKLTYMCTYKSACANALKHRFHRTEKKGLMYALRYIEWLWNQVEKILYGMDFCYWKSQRWIFTFLSLGMFDRIKPTQNYVFFKNCLIKFSIILFTDPIIFFTCIAINKTLLPMKLNFYFYLTDYQQNYFKILNRYVGIFAI